MKLSSYVDDVPETEYMEYVKRANQSTSSRQPSIVYI